MATIKDVAQRAGVSVATVSRVINRIGAVREETQRVVEQAIAELGYAPNMLGRHLRTMETKRILVILNSISNQFYSRVVRGVEDCAQERGYSVTICTTRDNREKLLAHLDMLYTRSVDGAIMMFSELGPVEMKDLGKSLPLVCACEPSQTAEIPSVSIDDRQAGFDAVRFLLSRGNKRIAAFGAGNYAASSAQREVGYRQALGEAGIPVREEWIINEGLSFRAGQRAAERLLSCSELPDAVFAFSDSLAIGAISEFARRGLRVPEDISVMGFDDTAIAEMYLPPLTTVAQPQYEMGWKAMELLVKRMQGVDAMGNLTVPHNIVVRNSVK